MSLGRFGRDADAQADAECNGQDDEEDDEGAPPLELAAAAGMLVGLPDLLIALLNVLDGIDGIVLGLLNDRVLLLHDGGQLLVENGEFRECLFDVLQLIVACAHITK